MALHVFVAMPFGRKQDIDFDAVYAEWLKPALSEAGYEVFRADEERRAGDIRTDMFQELLLADLVVVDLTLDNPNVWYELGVRHALRARGVLLVQSERSYQPFDIYTDRKLRTAGPIRSISRTIAVPWWRWRSRRWNPGMDGRSAPCSTCSTDCRSRLGGNCCCPVTTSFATRTKTGIGASNWRARATAQATSCCWPTRRRPGPCAWRRGAWRARRC